ncbi:hypothetical protein CDCA_CDCA07G2274 [Cyanidium caldarium]|uniref:F-box domain-containing protein n=1 Tax=Cyanidium caldarium TaxID=2771 RepID=A0AAV9IVD6_CYACA|nr:hypothetical protein CDCA_CDCA07G2274 [Cyanidium caldarium]
MRTTSFGGLPDEVLAEVLWLASDGGEELAWLCVQAAAVCSRWHVAVRLRVLPRLQRVVLTSLERHLNRTLHGGDRGPKAPAVAERPLAWSASLQRLLDDCCSAHTLAAGECYRLISDRTVRGVERWPARLRQLHFSHCARLGDDGLECLLQRLNGPSVHTLTFFSGKFTVRAAQTIAARCPQLQHLALPYSLLDDEGLRALAQLQCLTHLQLRGCEHITDAGVCHLTTVQTLDLALCPQVTDRALLRLARHGRLRELTLAYQRYNVWCSGRWTPCGVDSVQEAGVSVRFIDA